jgi:small-conductance mechanosensitive channel
MSESIAVDLPFTLAIDTIWNYLDDFFLCIGVIIISVPLVLFIGSTTQHYFLYSLWTGQMITFVLLASVFLYLFAHIAGETASVSILQGFALGIGYALQPYIVSLLSGATYFSAGMIKANDTIVVDNVEYVVIENGILYIEAKEVTESGSTVFIPNNFFNNTYLKKRDNKFIN